MTTDPTAALDEHSVPERYRAPKFTTFDDAMSTDWAAELGGWLYDRRGDFHRGGDDYGAERFNHELLEVDEVCDLVLPLKQKITALVPDAADAVGIPDFDVEHIECHATLYHHGSHFTWHTDRDGMDGKPVTTRRLSYCYYMHSLPRMFQGGELEFHDGTTVESLANRLVMFSPYQQHRVRRVECWSSEFLHGRWAVFGWIHGQPPGSTGHLEGRPQSG